MDDLKSSQQCLGYEITENNNDIIVHIDKKLGEYNKENNNILAIET